MNKLLPFTLIAVLGVAHADQVPHAPPADSAKPADPAPDADTALPASVKPAARPAAKPAAKPADGAVPSITVQGSRANDVEQRRNATASKMIFGREELDRNGDSSVGEILKRLPGVTMGGRPGRGGEVRMRGLGSGYTQVLVNGERAPAGFAIDSLSPDQVERIEVIRGPVAEHSTQAIAGTINIVLREGYQQKDIQLKLTDNIEQDRHGPNVSLTVPGKAGALTYLLSGSVFTNRQHDESVTYNQDVTAAGVLQKDQVQNDESNRRSRGIHLSPRLVYKFENSDTLTFQPFIVSNRSEGTTDSQLAQRLGLIPAEYVTATGQSTNSGTFIRGFGNWLHRMEAGAKLDVKYGFGKGHTDSEVKRLQVDAAKVQTLLLDTDASKDHGFTVGGKYTTPIAQGHLLAAGLDIESQHREQSKVSLENGVARFVDSGANLSADTRRMAGFIQDEWDITPQLSAYLGLRWEGIRTTSDNASRGDISNTSRVMSPVLHGVWRIPGYEKDQIRASLTRSYKAPTVGDLIAAPSFSLPNTAVRPDRVGNPLLKPELARGVDFAYEHYLGKNGIVSVSGFVREIDDLMRRVTEQRMTSDGLRWVSTPVNIGHASTRGLEFEAKFQLSDVMADAPNVDLRANYSRYWSRVDDVPGPDNRLDGQASQTGNFGIDYRLKDLPLTLGGSLNWTPPVTVRTSANDIVNTGVKRQLDVYGLWKFSANTQLRIGANNLLAKDSESGRIYTQGGLSQMSNTFADTYTTWSVKLELKL
jgi:outer membrane receptor for ferrienterochelin and colicins